MKGRWKGKGGGRWCGIEGQDGYESSLGLTWDVELCIAVQCSVAEQA